jgi:hypothetical protein
MWNPPEIEYILLLFSLISIEAIQGNIHTHTYKRKRSLSDGNARLDLVTGKRLNRKKKKKRTSSSSSE